MDESPFDHPVVSERYFFPRRSTPPHPVILRSGEVELACWSLTAHSGAPSFVHFHGNGEVVADYVPELAEVIASLGLNPFFAEYRGFGASTGHPRLVAMLADVDAIYDAACSPGSKTIVYGRSVGSIYAIELAARHPDIAGLILESGIADPLERILLRVQPREVGSTVDAMSDEAHRHLDHRKKLAEIQVPVLVLHARHDTLVPISNGERLASWSGGELVVFDQGDHNTMLAHNGPAIMKEVARFVHGC